MSRPTPAGLVKASTGQPAGPCRLCGATAQQSRVLHRSAHGNLAFLRCLAIGPGGAAVESSLLHCGLCDFAYFSPCPEQSFLDDYYANQRHGGGTDEAALAARLESWSFGQENEAIAAFLAAHGVALGPGFPGTLLEIGSGAGEFAHFARRRGLRVVAVEPGRAHCDFLRRHLDCEVVESTLEAMPEAYDGSAALVFCKESLEHHPAPAASLARFFALLAPGGRLFLTFPNLNSWTLQQDVFDHPYFAFPAHLNYFSVHAIEGALERAGFRVEAAETSTFTAELAWCYERAIRLRGARPEWHHLDEMTRAGAHERILVLAAKP